MSNMAMVLTASLYGEQFIMQLQNICTDILDFMRALSGVDPNTMAMVVVAFALYVVLVAIRKR